MVFEAFYTFFKPSESNNKYKCSASKTQRNSALGFPPKADQCSGFSSIIGLANEYENMECVIHDYQIPFFHLSSSVRADTCNLNGAHN
jgi:hypothetical protein